MFASNEAHQEVSKANLDRIVAAILKKVRQHQHIQDSIAYNLDSKTLDEDSVSLNDVRSALRRLDYNVETKGDVSLHRPVIYILTISW